MAAGLATLHVLAEENLVANAARVGDCLIQELRKLQANCSLIRDVRGKGLLIGVEFGEPAALALKVPWKTLKKARPDLFAQIIATELFRHHSILTEVAAGESVVKLRPPLSVTEVETTRCVDALEDTLKRVQSFPGPLWSFGMSLARHAITGASKSTK